MVQPEVNIMAYYIKYPTDRSKPVKVVTKRPRPSMNYLFAEGPFKMKAQVGVRLKWMDIKASRRPAKFR
jgi:hypothetical protein